MSDPVNRNPHPDFKGVESSRPDWDTSSAFRYTKTADPSWTFGSGANRLAAADPGSSRTHIGIDPYAEGRPPVSNYKLLISAIVPRPIGFLSTRSADGASVNLAPFSYFNVVNHDPPLFTVGFASGVANAKDTLKNLLEAKECVVNIISETFLEAANATSVNAPYGVSEWELTGLTPVYDCATVKAARVKEAIFSVEAKLDMFKEYDSKSTPGKKSGTLIVLEGIKFWVREDAINEDKNIIDPAVGPDLSCDGNVLRVMCVC
jgi:flavin reductase (DIM6/NTAB) family NADH-FMN oxidoreductase RutF